MNTIGQYLRFTSYGESHGYEVGGILDGFPAGFEVNLEKVQEQLNRRRPGQSDLTTQRKEEDVLEITSGMLNGVTTGAPIHFRIKNKDAKPKDYDNLKDVYRPSHADYSYDAKYGIRDHRGGGRSSARVTASWVAAGAMAEQYLENMHGVSIVAFVDRVATEAWNAQPAEFSSIKKEDVDHTNVRCPDKKTSAAMIDLIERAKADKDSLGGSIIGCVHGIQAGIGDPVFSKLNARLALNLMSINAVKAFEIGGGFEMTHKRGSEVNDAFTQDGDVLGTKTNFSGGIQGGISNGQFLYFRLGFKPTATIGIEQQTITSGGEEITLEASGRHDPCVLPRAVPIVEGMTALALMDAYLKNKTSRV
jgi:chorismate synthase